MIITKGLFMKNASHKKLQSAMEYLMTYGWAILIIAVVIGVLYAMGIFNGSGLLGSFCTAQTGYFCANPILSTNSPTLNVTIGQDTRLEWSAWKIFAVRGTAFNASSPNITGSGAFYNGEKQIVTIPLNSILGNYIPIGTPFSGSLWAEYCNTPNCNTPDQVSEIGIFYTKAAKLGYVTTSVSTSSISTTSTTSTSTTSTSTTSTTTTAPTTTIVPSGIIYSVPITLTNSQSSNTPAPFQQMVNITESTYSSYLTYNGNFANFEYYTLSGNTVSVLPAWIESSNSGKLITWVNLPDGIPAESSITIYLGFASTSTNLLSSSGTTGIGEAPQLSPTYAEYDDGASVFTNYWNFAGTSLPSGWTSGAVSGSTVMVNNGLTISGDGTTAGSTYAATSSAVFNNNEILEGYINQNSGSTGGERGMLGISTINNAEPVWDYGGGSEDTIAGWSAGKNQVLDIIQSETVLNGATTYLNSISYNSNMYIYSVALSSSNGVTTFVNYGSVSPASSTTSDNPSAPLYVNLGVYNTGGGAPFNLQYTWLRIRAYPPSGVMPSVSFGSVQGGSPSVTVSPSSVSLLPGTGFTLTATVSDGTSPYTYQWYNATSGTLITGATSSTYTATAGSAAGTFDYYVTVTDSESKTAQSPNSVVTVSLPPSGITYYVPITLTNSQSTATPSPFQQMVNITENSTIDKYLTYNSNFANFEYISPSGTVLPAWIENSNSGKLITWVNLPNGIPANSNTIIYLGFTSNTVNLLSSTGTTGIGEAPQLSPTYAEYDDGASVFLSYFNGDASASDFTVTSGYTLTQVTGVTMPNGNTGNVIYITGYTTTSPGGWIPFVYDNGYPLQPSIIESSVQLHGNTATAQGIAGVLTNTAIASANGIGVTMGVYSSYFSQEYESSGSVTADINQQGSSVTSWIYGAVTFTGTSSTSWTGYIAPQLYSATGGYSGTVTTQPITSGTELYLSNLGSTYSGSFPYNLYINWERARTYPPNGVMPSVSFGTVS